MCMYRIESYRIVSSLWTPSLIPFALTLQLYTQLGSIAHYTIHSTIAPTITFSPLLSIGGSDTPSPSHHRHSIINSARCPYSNANPFTSSPFPPSPSSSNPLHPATLPPLRPAHHPLPLPHPRVKSLAPLPPLPQAPTTPQDGHHSTVRQTKSSWKSFPNCSGTT